jgi:serine phosphatase RsbU (regulator of sigma subunit)/anti-sigma regulatory factor (Ser/Thr protein kinase)/putative methionine-R-sulfoxide reductase with GAF domain
MAGIVHRIPNICAVPDEPVRLADVSLRIDISTVAALQRVTDTALAYFTEEERLQELLRLISDILEVDTVAILLLEGDFLHARAAKGIEEEVEQGVRIPLGRGFAGRIAAERRPIFLPDVNHADVLNPLLREKGIRSLLGVPMVVENVVIGVLHVGSLTPREFSADETSLLQLAADRAALAIEHGRIFTREREAREAAELANARLQALQRVTDAALAYLPLEELLQELLQRVSEIMHVDTVAILLLEGDSLHARAAKGIEEEVEQGVRIPIGGGFAGRIAAERRPIFLPDVDHADILNPLLREKGIRSLLGVPMVVESAVIGVLHVGSLTLREFSADDSDLLQLAADRAALAIEQARTYEQRRVAEALQRQLLPADRPENVGLETASRYLPAAGGSLGGDWYDIFPVPYGRVAIAVGDVVGHGLQAAAVMAQLRTALRCYAVEGHPPAVVVDRVNYLMSSLGPNSMTTLAYIVLDPATESLELVNAGHPPPLIVDPSGAARFLEPPGGVALGATPTAVYEAATFPLPTGSIVCLYTDGLVENRRESIDVGLERLRVAAEGFDDVEALCSTVVAHLVAEGPADDVAFVAARVPPLGDSIRARWPANPGALADVRNLLRRWLYTHGAADAEAYDIVVAAQEACANVIEHAYGPGAASFELEADHDAGRISIVVRDHGRWRAPRGENRGRGLPMMRALMDEVDVRESERGTEVVLTRTLGRDA